MTHKFQISLHRAEMMHGIKPLRKVSGQTLETGTEVVTASGSVATFVSESPAGICWLLYHGSHGVDMTVLQQMYDRAGWHKPTLEMQTTL